MMTGFFLYVLLKGVGEMESCISLLTNYFTAFSAVPTLSNTNAFTGIAADCEIRVPASLVNKWKAATNWATYANYIVGV